MAWWVVRVTPWLRTSADDFMPARLYHDLFVDGGALADWYLPASPYWFPDLAVYFGLLAAAVPLDAVATAYALVIAVVTVASTAWLSRALLTNSVNAWFVALATMAGLIAVGEADTFWNRPIFHYGVFINALLAAGCLLRSAARPAWLLPLFAIVAAAVVSDFLFIPIITAATTGFAAVAWLRGRRAARTLACLPVVAAAVLCGYGLYFLLTPNAPGDPTWASGLHLRYGLFHPLTHLEGIRFAASQLIDPYYGVALVPVVGALVVTWGGETRSRFLAVSAFFAGGMLANLHVVGLDTEPSAFARYSLFATNGAIAWAALSTGFILDALAPVRRAAPAALLACVAAALAYSTSARHDARAAELQRARDCLVELAERENLRYGIASYDDANRYSVLTGHRLRLRPVKGNSLAPLRWQRSRAWDAWPVRLVLADPPVPTSVYASARLSYPLDEGVVTAAAGEPVARYDCPGVTALVYPPGTL